MWSKATEKISVCINNSENNTESKLFKKDVNRKIQCTSKDKKWSGGYTINTKTKISCRCDTCKGLVRSKIWFSFKIGAINAKKSTKNGSGDGCEFV
jgi:hypothetical protein